MQPSVMLPVAAVMVVMVMSVAVPGEQVMASYSGITVHRQVLNNGMVVLVAEDHSAPTFCYTSFFKVGSRNERPGITGISHLFEHMMFNGSEKFGPKVFDQLIESGGGYSNGSTWYDYTTYHEEVSSDGLQTVLDLEADRMRALTISKENLEQERSIVKEERRLRTDNAPEGKIFEVLMSNAFVASPYRWPIVGWEPDLDNISLEDCRKYFRTYYAPNNAIVTIVGDVETEEVVRSMRRAFEGIPAQEPPRAVIDAEPAQKGEKRIIHRMHAELPAVMVGYKAVAFKHEDYAALEVIRSILTDGDSSRLYRGLIYQKQIANEVYAFFRPTLMAGLFVVYAQGKQDVEGSRMESAIYEELVHLGATGVGEHDLQKAKNQIRADALRDMQDNAGKAGRVAFYELLGGTYQEMDAVLDRIDKVTADDVGSVARKYFKPDGRTVVTLVPESHS
ncbi:MAG: M16 family metallopeptidase [Acidobacteriota bacterium]